MAYATQSRAPAADAAWWLSGALIAGGVFLVNYINWRPATILFTWSDILFIGGAFALLAASRLQTKPFGALTPYWMTAVALMLFGLLVGSAINGEPFRWLTAAMQYSFGLVALPMLLLEQGTRRTNLLIWALILGVVAMELIGISLYYAYDASYTRLQRFGPDFVTGGGRLSAFLADANWNAAIVVMATPFVLYLRARGLLSTFFLIAILIVFGLALILAASVTGLTSAIVAITIFILAGRIRFSLPMIVGLIATVGTLTLFFSDAGLPRAFQNRIAPALESGHFGEAGTFSGRWELIREAWDIANETTIVGLGVDQYRVVSGQEAPVHNIFLLLWTEGGLLAMLSWIGLIAILALASLRARRFDPAGAALGLAVISVFLVFSTAAPHMYARIWVVPLFLAVAPALAVLRASSARKLPSTGPLR